MCVRTVVDLSGVVAQRDDLHPLLSVQVVVQLLRRQLEPARRSFAAVLQPSADAALHAGRHHADPPTALLFRLMEKPHHWVVTLLVLRGDHHHHVSPSSSSWSSSSSSRSSRPSTYWGQRLPEECYLLGDGQLGDPCRGGDGDGGGWGESCCRRCCCC